MAFFRGMHPNGYGDLYPLGTSSRYNTQGVEIGTLSLRWDGEDGLLENYWKEWDQFLRNAKTTKWEIKLETTDILQLQMQRKVKIHNNYYMIKTISVNFPLNKSATVELVRI